LKKNVKHSISIWTLQGATNMALSLQKGGNLSLSKAAPNLTNIRIGLGWDVRTTDGAAFDLRC
jgi:hypothetical protein